MFAQFGRRSISLLLALVMVLSMVPVQAFAMEDGHDHIEEEVHAALTAIAVTTLPAKTEYAQNQESLDVSGGMLTLTYSDGCTGTVAMTADMVSGFDRSRAGVQTLTVTYGGLTTTYTVTVSAPVAALSDMEPVETTPVETTPAETTPAETTPVEPTPAETTPAETTPVETTPAETTPVETTPAETTPAETTPEETTPEETLPAEEAPSALALDLAERINTILNFYGVTADMTDDEIRMAINAHSWSENKPNIAKINAIEADAQMATDADEIYVVAHADVVTYVRFTDIWKPMFALVKATKGSFTPVTGVEVAVSGATDTSMSADKAVTVTAKGYGGIFLGIGASAKTATVTIYNKTASKANISFSWTCTDVHSLTVDGTSKTGGSGSYTKTLEAGGSFTLSMTTDKNDTVNKIVLNDFSIVEVVDVDLEFLYDSSLGSITVAGQPVENGTTLTVTSDGTDIAATAKNGSTFLGWVDQTNKVISRDAVFKLMPSVGMTQVRAIFATTTPWFLVGGGELHEGLTAAVEAVANTDGKTIVLMNNATLPAGDYTIPAGVTMLIPFDAGNTLYTTDPECIESYTKPTVYRTLTMASGANIIVNGALSLSARESAQKQKNGHPTGPVSRIVMQSNSAIMVNSGANLYAWGFISGSGKVTINNGGTVYENFQLTNWRGGQATLGMVDNKNRVLPMSQYYVQNVEVPMYLMAGATEKCHMSIYIGGIGVQDTNVPFVGPDGMFNILSGHVVKDYDETTDRLIFDVYDGSVAMKPLSISMKLSLIGGNKTINSASYTMPINGNITVHIHSGNIVVDQDIAMLPGSKLIVDEGATCSVAKDKKIFAYDGDQWGLYLCDVQKSIMPLDYVPGRTCAARGVESLVDAEVIINGTVDASNGFVYTTKGGANVRSDGTGVIIIKRGTQAQTHQAKQGGSDGTDITYEAIDITPAKLKNADGSYRETDLMANNATMTFRYQNGEWVADCQHENPAITPAVEPTCTEAGSLEGRHCTACGEVLATPDTVAAKGHATSAVAYKAPTCTQTGNNAYYVCGRCGQPFKDSAAATPTTVEAETIKALGHTMTKTDARAANCTEPGNNEYYTCETCGGVYQDVSGNNPTTAEKEVIAVWGHSMVKTDAVSAGCETAGNNEYYTCKICHVVFKDSEGKTVTTEQDEIIPSIGHTAGAEPTCTTNQACETCGKELQKALGHTMTKVAAKAAACGVAGNNEYYACDICKNVYKDSKGTTATTVEAETLAALTHVSNNAVVTCTTGQNCRRCGAEMVAPLGHTMTKTEAKAVTCTEDGNVAYYTCETCKKLFADEAGEHETDARDVVIVSDGHEMVKTDAKAVTCTEDGNIAYFTCETCKKLFTDEDGEKETNAKDVVIATNGHEMVKTDAKAVTCTEDGNIAYFTCETCKKLFTDEDGENETTAEAVVIVSDGHEMIKTEAKAVTCTEDGNIAYFTCETCKKLFTDEAGDTETNAQDVVIATDGHEMVRTAGKSATCTEDGNIAYYTCETCEKLFTDSEGENETNAKAVILPATNHNMAEMKPVAATCDRNGTYGYFTCEWCFLTFKDAQGAEQTTVKEQVIPATGHDYGEWYSTKNATCVEDGENRRDCQNPGCSSYETDTVAQTGHDYSGVTTAPTCTEAGYITYTCENCGDSYQQSNNRPALGHKMTKTGAREAACTEDGNIAYYTCRTCKKLYTDEAGENETNAQDVVIASDGHEMVKTEARGATCTEDGNIAYYTCETCKKLFVDEAGENETNAKGVVIVSDGHEMVKTEAVGATCTEDGNIAYYTCETCKKLYTDEAGKNETNAQDVVIATDGHEMVKTEASAATCTEDGNIAYYTCETCKKLFTDEAGNHETTAEAVVIATDGHEMVRTQAKAATCTADGNIAYYTCETCKKLYTDEAGETETTAEAVVEKALDHAWDEGRNLQGQAPTCLDDGILTFYCTRDNCKAVDTKTDPKLDHDIAYDAQVDPTCEKNGEAAGSHCTRCDFVTGNTVIDALGHDWNAGKVTREPSCVADGTRLFTCQRKNCGTTKEEAEKATGHVFGSKPSADVAKAATCTEPAHYYVQCDNCTEVSRAHTVESGAALNHAMTKIEATGATCTENGNVEHYSCGRCNKLFADEKGKKETTAEAVVIVSDGHEMIKTEAKAVTCTEDGNIAYFTCETCKKLFTDEDGENETNAKAVVIASDGHEMVKTEDKAATCTAEGNIAYYTCETCEKLFADEQGKTMIAVEDTVRPMLDHDYGDWFESKKSSCTETGTKRRNCKNCAHYEEETLPALGHDYVSEVTAPTCEEAGFTTYTCKVCGDSYTDDFTDALMHKYKAVVVNATCTQKGYTTYSCEKCGDTYEANEKPALGHKMTETVPSAATCTEDGTKGYFVCDRCSGVFKDDQGSVKTTVEAEFLPAAGHAMTKTEAKAVTCTEDGNIAYFTCATCKKLFTDEDGENEVTAEDVVIATDGHEMVKTGAKAATCTEDGNIAYYTCETCKKLFLDEAGENETTAKAVVIASDGHEMVKTEAKAATCTEDGNIAYYTCEACKKLYTDEAGESETTAKDVVIASDGHEMVKTEARAVTCTEDGNIAYYTCATCKKLYTDEAGKKQTTAEAVVIATDGHDLAKTEAKAATCTEDGNIAYYTCETCKKLFVDEQGDTEITAKDVVIATDGHEMVKTEAKAATCTEAGNKEYHTCSTCKLVFEDAAATKQTTVKLQTISAAGHTPGAEATCTDDQICTVCKASLVAALGHDYVDHAAKQASCEEIGWDAYQTCRFCDYSTYVEQDALDHARVAHEAKAATCLEIGWEAFETCERCDYTTYVEVKALDHDRVAHEAKAATCEEIGWKAYETCSRCDYTTKKEIDALGHKEMAIRAVDPTCTDTGLTEGVKCSVCGKVLVAQETVDALGHEEVVDEAVAPSCETTGLSEGKHCERCDETLVKQEEVAETGHSLIDATCTAPICCENAGCTYTEGEPLGHTEVIDEEEPALCEDDGLAEGSHCSVCGATITEQKVIPALGHSIWQYDAKKPTYTGVGWDAYEACSRCAYSTKVEYPALGEPVISDYDTFLTNLILLEELAYGYTMENPGKDPAALVIKYIRTGVERYNSGSWGIMAGYEDADFAKYISQTEDEINAIVEDGGQMLMVSGLKNLENFTLPNGELADIGHVFGMMDITYHNNFGLNHADVAGWAGDTVDLLSLTDQFGVSGTLDEMVADITANYLLKDNFPEKPIEGSFNETDMFGDMDGFYIMQQLAKQGYEKGTLTAIFREYFTPSLNAVSRAEYFLKTRLGGVTLRNDVRNAVYNAYTGNKLIATLEGTREFTSDNLGELKKACCYAVADYLCRLAGDYVDVSENAYYSVLSEESSNLAPGITQDIKVAMSADNKQMVYYIATADLTRSDVQIYANYTNNDPSAGWAMSRVLDQANAAQKKYGDPESEHYIENYNVIASVNGSGYNMQTGEPGGVLVMNGVEYHPINSNGFFGILKDGTPVIGTTQEYNTIYKGQVQEAIAGFGAILVKDGKIAVSHSDNHTADRASRTAAGITKTGKVVFMVLDGRQEPWSCGGSMQEIAQIMLEAGCVHAVNLDGGGSTTFVSKQEGEDSLSVINRPSDGTQRSVSTSMIVVSTAPSSTAFDHAILETETNYMTVGSSQQVTAEGVSATGNAAEVPEGTTWKVSDEQWGQITEDGVFTALRNGTVDIFLMQDDTVIGQKTMEIVIPDNVYFTKGKLDVVYGETVQLPLKALYNGKAVTIVPEDVLLTMDNPAAGAFGEFSFTAASAGNVRTVNVTAALATDNSVKASIALSLYNQGEASFAFEQAIGGDRQLAWDRKVSNSTTEDNVTYNVVNPGQDMVTSYTFAIDMTQIPVPERLEELTYMLPGADMEGASAWTFLLQLAQRVSVLSEVRPVIHFDPNFHVDYSNMTLVNEYFDLEGVEMDEETNTMTMILRWKKQTQAIDPDEANPICIVSGVKLTPKENASWNTKNALTVVHYGEVGYNICLRASSLYSFAQKPENQAVFGLMPYVNPADSSDAGASFGDVYKEFEDTYTLVRTLKNGWVNEDGGFAYYVDGEKQTGIMKVDGYYYDFGENGINVGQTKYNGVFFDKADQVYRYAKFGEVVNGWYLVDGEWYYFNSVTKAATPGYFTTGGIEYHFEENGRLTSGVWVHDENGSMYYYGPGRYVVGWQVIDGETYYFENAYCYKGYRFVVESNDSVATWYDFGENGARIGKLDHTGLLKTDMGLYYLENGISKTGLVKVDGEYYYFRSQSRAAVVSQKYTITNTNGLDLKQGTYNFGADGKILMKEGLVKEEDGIYYYEDGVRVYAGLIRIGEYYYYIRSNYQAVTDRTYYVQKTNDLMPVANYSFDSEGRMILNGFVKENDGTYYYEDSVRVPAGMIKIGIDYYYVRSNCQVVIDRTYYAQVTNGLMPVGNYTFDDKGRLKKNGFVEEDGGVYYYVDGKRTGAGMIMKDGYLYYVRSSGQVVTNQTYYAQVTNGLMPVANYTFDATGRMMLNGLVQGVDGIYYYENGIRVYAGLTKIGDYYYYVRSNYQIVTDRVYYIQKTNDLMPVGNYRFDKYGRMEVEQFDPNRNGLVEQDGELYYYVAGVKTYAGLIEIDGYYYYIRSNYQAVRNQTYYIQTTNGLLPVGNYTFDAKGRMIREGNPPEADVSKNGLVEEDGVIYYYVDGVKTAAGLIEIDGYYYYIRSNCQAVRNQTYYAQVTNGLMPVANYTFDAKGRMIREGNPPEADAGKNGLVEEDSVIYYYVDGFKTYAGLIEIDGYYYYIRSNYQAVRNQTYYVQKTNGLMPVANYTFDAEGRMVDKTA